MRNRNALNRVLPTLRSKLARAKATGDPVLVLGAVEEAAEAFNRYGWPDGWMRWRIALDDARWAYASREAQGDLYDSSVILARFAACDQRLMF